MSACARELECCILKKDCFLLKNKIKEKKKIQKTFSELISIYSTMWQYLCLDFPDFSKTHTLWTVKQKFPKVHSVVAEVIRKRHTA